MSAIVALARDPIAVYPTRPPFHPGEIYPELGRATWIPSTPNAEPNDAYRLVRESLRLLGLDAERYGSPDWNPLSTIVPRGGRVVVKPNLVLDERGAQRGRHCLITHAAIVRAVVDYALLAGGPSCRVVIADAPLQQANFETILRDTGLSEVVRFYRAAGSLNVDVVDLRRTRVAVDDRRVITGSFSLPGDPRGYTTVRLNSASTLEAITGTATQFAVTDYDRAEMARHHSRGHHEYLISRTVLEADAFINVPKLKTHQKVGVTLALKNLVGINGSKDWLPHYRPGAPEQGGDEFPERNLLSSAHSSIRSVLQGRSPRAMRAAQSVWTSYKRLVERTGFGLSSVDRAMGGRTVSGAWYGNDTTWRMVLDLNQAIFHADGNGTMGLELSRSYLAIIDGIVGGEGDGPLSPEPKSAGIVAASQDPVALDRVCAHVMGFDPDRMPLLREASGGLEYQISNLKPNTEPTVKASSPGKDWTRWDLGFRAAPGWRGHMERHAEILGSATQRNS